MKGGYKIVSFSNIELTDENVVIKGVFNAIKNIFGKQLMIADVKINSEIKSEQFIIAEKMGSALYMIKIYDGVITITKDDVVQFVGYGEIDDMTKLTTEQINSLKCGDVIVKITGNQKHAYIVSYKEEEQGICLTYTDAENVETVSYDYTDGEWVYNSTDITNIGGNV